MRTEELEIKANYLKALIKEKRSLLDKHYNDIDSKQKEIWELEMDIDISTDLMRLEKALNNKRNEITRKHERLYSMQEKFEDLTAKDMTSIKKEIETIEIKLSKLQ
ncbi:hypothetical protein ACFPYJ_17760 [Paenibacillus solisilvae]|uniref:Uncharacterized protein n=1 Tax=Paenibacillus solisilvae TaxID=2486751 RepID=A0ABW0W3C3_9BACL